MAQLPEIAQALLKPDIYPEPPHKVELMQTQMSFVFLADDYVYKVKKPVNLGYLDYTTLEKRRFFCQREVELNRRLCSAYLGVIPITRDKGAISLGGSGEAVEYAVKMRYLPQDRMMNVLLSQSKVTSDMVKSVAQRLSEFHEKAETGDAISRFGSLEAIRVNTDENFDQTESYINRTITREQFARIKNCTNDFMQKNATLLQKRQAEGKIRDCHGDLHAAHICFHDGVCIYDCIEFNDRFRYCDVASEVAFLAMDLDHYGRNDLSQAFIEAYVSFSGDSELMKLLDFYKCYRAYVRGKVEGFHLDDPHISPADKEKALAAARGYFGLAEGYT